MIRRKRIASSIVDYGILVFVIVTVIVVMGKYIQRGLMGKYKEAGDAYGQGRLYDE